MSTEMMLKGFAELENGLVEQCKSDKWKVTRKLLLTILKTYQMELSYAKSKAKYDIYLEFCESATPLTEMDISNIKQAVAVNKRIGKQLSDQKKAA